jgi:hypothetical protein
MLNVKIILILSLAIYGLVLIMAKDIAIPETIRKVSLVQDIYNNSAISGIICIGVAYYFYTCSTKDADNFTSEFTSEMTPEIPPPTFAQSTSE